MDKGVQQKPGEVPPRAEEQKENLSELPMKSSPYLQYDNLEDYKLKGYGAEGHQEPKVGRGAASSTDAPTLSGAAVSSDSDGIRAAEKTLLHSK